MKRTAHAVWNGGLEKGQGRFGVGSGVIQGQKFDFGTRFRDEPGTNPEELVAAAHAACFSMALSNELGEAGIEPDAVETTAAITFENLTLTKSVLTTNVRAPGADRSRVEAAAEAARTGCPLSKVLDLEIELDLNIDV
jgi:osmotically inducible protein OsmC